MNRKRKRLWQFVTFTHPTQAGLCITRHLMDGSSLSVYYPSVQSGLSLLSLCLSSPLFSILASRPLLFIAPPPPSCLLHTPLPLPPSLSDLCRSLIRAKDVGLLSGAKRPAVASALCLWPWANCDLSDMVTMNLEGLEMIAVLVVVVLFVKVLEQFGLLEAGYDGKEPLLGLHFSFLWDSDQPLVAWLWKHVWWDWGCFISSQLDEMDYSELWTLDCRWWRFLLQVRLLSAAASASSVRLNWIFYFPAWLTWHWC